MCECFGRADYQIEELPPRYYGGPSTRRISLVRNVERDDEDTYSRPRPSNTSVRQAAYRPARNRRNDYFYDERDRSTYRSPNQRNDYFYDKRDRSAHRSTYRSPPQIEYPKSSRFVALPPVIRDDYVEEIREPKKSVLRKGKQKNSSQPSMIVYSPKRGRKERKYYYEDEDSDSDSSSWDGRSGRTFWSESSGDSWAIRPVAKYPTMKRKGRSRSRGRGYYQ